MPRGATSEFEAARETYRHGVGHWRRYRKHLEKALKHVLNEERQIARELEWRRSGAAGSTALSLLGSLDYRVTEVQAPSMPVVRLGTSAAIHGKHMIEDLRSALEYAAAAAVRRVGDLAFEEDRWFGLPVAKNADKLADVLDRRKPSKQRQATGKKAEPLRLIEWAPEVVDVFKKYQDYSISDEDQRWLSSLHDLWNAMKHVSPSSGAHLPVLQFGYECGFTSFLHPRPTDAAESQSNPSLILASPSADPSMTGYTLDCSRSLMGVDSLGTLKSVLGDPRRDLPPIEEDVRYVLCRLELMEINRPVVPFMELCLREIPQVIDELEAASMLADDRYYDRLVAMERAND